jgi:hypothetical protein
MRRKNDPARRFRCFCRAIERVSPPVDAAVAESPLCASPATAAVLPSADSPLLRPIDSLVKPPAPVEAFQIFWRLPHPCPLASLLSSRSLCVPVVLLLPPTHFPTDDDRTRQRGFEKSEGYAPGCPSVLSLLLKGLNGAKKARRGSGRGKGATARTEVGRDTDEVGGEANVRTVDGDDDGMSS